MFFFLSEEMCFPFLNAFRVVLKNTRNKDVYKSCKKIRLSQIKIAQANTCCVKVTV